MRARLRRRPHSRSIGAMVFGAGLRCASVWFRAPAVLGRGITWVFVLGVAWTIFAATYLRPGAVVGPAFVLMSVWQARAAVSYLATARRVRMVGPLLTGLGVAGMVMVNTVALSVAIDRRIKRRHERLVGRELHFHHVTSTELSGAHRELQHLCVARHQRNRRDDLVANLDRDLLRSVWPCRGIVQLQHQRDIALRVPERDRSA